MPNEVKLSGLTLMPSRKSGPGHGGDVTRPQLHHQKQLWRRRQEQPRWSFEDENRESEREWKNTSSSLPPFHPKPRDQLDEAGKRCDSPPLPPSICTRQCVYCCSNSSLIVSFNVFVHSLALKVGLGRGFSGTERVARIRSYRFLPSPSRAGIGRQIKICWTSKECPKSITQTFASTSSRYQNLGNSVVTYPIMAFWP